MHKYLQSAAKAQLPEYTIVPTPRVTVAQSPRDTVTQSPIHTVAQSPRVTVAQSPRDTVAQSPRDTVETPRSRHLFFLGNLLSCPPTSRLLLVRVSTNELSGSADQRVVRVGGPTSCPGRRTNEQSGSADQRVVRVVHQRVVRVGGPTSGPGRRTKCNGCLPLSCAEA